MQNLEAEELIGKELQIKILEANAVRALLMPSAAMWRHSVACYNNSVVMAACSCPRGLCRVHEQLCRADGHDKASACCFGSCCCFVLRYLCQLPTGTYMT